jgi:soluble lytic murein transglycosylase
MLRLLILTATLALASPARADDAESLRLALLDAGARDWPAAAARAAEAGAVAADIVEWLRLRAGEGTLTEYEDFLARRPDWPGLTLLRSEGEVAVARSTNPERVLAWFGDRKPATAAGSMALIAAYRAVGNEAAARDEARRAWVALEFDVAEETAFLDAAGAAVDDLHAARLDRLLWDQAPNQAKRMLPRVGAGEAALARARLALQDGQTDGINALIEAVPASLAGDPGLAFDRTVWRMRQDREPDAATLMLERSESAALLGRPEIWAERRALLARWLMRNGDPGRAYRVASRHFLSEGQAFADLEFLAGFIALRQLGDPETAKMHFQRLKAAVSTGISLARADYWIGRAEEAAGRTEAARAAWSEAARHSTAFYGLLAAERLGQTLDARLLDDTRPPDWRQAAFATSSVMEAARLLLRAGDRTTAKRFLLHLAESLSPAEIDQLADFALSAGEPHIAVVLAKQAAERGAILPRAYFPVVEMVPDGLSVSRAFALAIARRESEFDPAAQSPAGALGLMQVLPETASRVARDLGLDYARGRLTSDPAYNVTLGSAYLAGLVEEFGPAVALVASGYNAGPGRPRRWITEFGDPRSASVDVIDWVETIPFTETRTYVMRVSEALVIYRARLRGSVGPVKLTGELTGR